MDLDDSDRWHRIAELRPALTSQVRVRRQHQRGQRWWLLVDPLSGRSVRLSRSAYLLAARFDGRHTVDALWRAMPAGASDTASQDEVIDLIAALKAQSLLQWPHADDDATAASTASTATNAATTAVASDAVGTRWAWRLRTPTALLAGLAGAVSSLLARRLAGVLIAAALLWLALSAWQDAAALGHYARRWASSPRGWWIALLLFPPIKVVHELAHGVVAQAAGARVHAVGLAFSFGLPLPYVDVSSSATLARRTQRVAIAAAGIIAELMIAALALALWRQLPDGSAREAAFAALGIAGVSTLLINGNPLQRLDGYHVATELLQLPNLAPRSRRYWIEQLRHRLLGLPVTAGLALAPGEAWWLRLYAPLSWCWRLVLSAGLVLWVAAQSAVLGWTLAVLLASAMVLLPARQLWTALADAAAGHAPARQRWRRARLAAGGVLLAVLALPLPHHRVVLGVLWPPEQAQLRAETDGFVAEVLQPDGAWVRAGDAVLRLDNPRQLAERDRLAAQLRTVQTQLPEAALGDGERAGNLQAELRALQLALTQAQAKVDQLLIRASHDGRLAWPEADDLPGRFVAQGQLLGQVLDGQPPTVRVAVAESDAAELPATGAAASVRLAARAASARAGRLIRDAHGATQQLPSAALGQDQGGPIVTDPQQADGRRTLQPVVLLDVQLDEPWPELDRRLGARAWVRLGLAWAPLAWQWADPATRRTLGQMNPWR